MLTRIRHLLELVRFSHTVFALPFALLAALMAWFRNYEAVPQLEFRWQELVGILWCMVTARNAAMAWNRLADQSIDAQNPRTSGRHLPAGLLSTKSVWSFALISSLLFIAGTFWFVPNWLPAVLSVPVLLFLIGYSYTKRFTSLAHFWLGLALMLAPISAWIAIRGAVVWQHPTDLLPAIILGAGVCFWVTGFDIIYACQDAGFDQQQGLHSVPARYGVAGALRIAAVCHLIAVAWLAALPLVFPELGKIYYSGLLLIAALLAFEHWLVRPHDLKRVNAAFFQVNAVISIGMLVIVGLELWAGR